ncbi:MAG: PQQ-binding-like beta-propeller repeat protein [Bacteriovoracaceae bacterium]
MGCAQVERAAENAGLEAPENQRPAFRPAWIKNLDPPYQTGNLPIGVGSPLIVEDLLFMGSLDGKMRAYKLENGRLIWEADDLQPINAKPALFEDMVIYGTMEGRVFARNYLTGELKYAIDLGSPVESAPVISAGRMFFHLRDHKIIALDASTGKVFWSYKRSVPFTTTLQRVSKPLPYKNRLIVGFADGYIVSLSMEEGVVAWEQKISDGVKFVDVDVDPVYFNGFVAAGSAAGTMKFIDPDNGMVARSVKLTIAHAPVKVKNSLVVGTIFGDVAIVDQDGEIIKKKKLTTDGVSSIVKWKKGYAVATMSGKVFYLNRLNLDVLGEFNLGHQQSAVFGHLQTGQDFLGLYSSRNRLYVFR